MDLPEGWFNDQDVALYRELVARVPCGGMIVEVGCHLGRSICSVLDLCLQRKLQVICVDPWGEYAEDPKRSGDERCRLFLANVERFGGKGTVMAMRTPSVEAARLLRDGSVDLVFIDGDHARAAVEADIAAWRPKLAPNGVMAGHDLQFPDVRAAVDEAFAPRVPEQCGYCWVIRGSA